VPLLVHVQRAGGHQGRRHRHADGRRRVPGRRQRLEPREDHRPPRRGDRPPRVQGHRHRQDLQDRDARRPGPQDHGPDLGRLQGDPDAQEVPLPDQEPARPQARREPDGVHGRGRRRGHPPRLGRQDGDETADEGHRSQRPRRPHEARGARRPRHPPPRSGHAPLRQRAGRGHQRPRLRVRLRHRPQEERGRARRDLHRAGRPPEDRRRGRPRHHPRRPRDRFEAHRPPGHARARPATRRSAMSPAAA
jgi:hypothetical protein